MARISSLISSVVGVNGSAGISSSMTLVRPFLTWLPTRKHFAVIKHSFHILLKVCVGFLPLIDLQPTSLFFGTKGNWSGHVNSATTTLKRDD
jgi:hypothetical protein